MWLEGLCEGDSLEVYVPKERLRVDALYQDPGFEAFESRVIRVPLCYLMSDYEALKPWMSSTYSEIALGDILPETYDITVYNFVRVRNAAGRHS